MRSCSEQPCHGTCVVLKATIDQKRLSGNALWSVHNRIASASIRNITNPRNASIDVMRAAGVVVTDNCLRGLKQLRREFDQIRTPVEPGVTAGALLEHRSETVLLQEL